MTPPMYCKEQRKHSRLDRVVQETSQDAVREIGMYSYRIMYELIGGTIYIHGIFHKRQEFHPEELERK